MGSEILLTLTAASKRFDGVQALQGVDLTLSSGEVQALVGANGSGKSTLVKILAGYHEPEPGANLTILGKPVRFAALGRPLHGFAFGFVHQELGLIEDLSVLDNFLLPIFAHTWSLRLPHRRLRSLAANYLGRFGVTDLDSAVSSLPRIMAALLALAKAVYSIEVHDSVAEPTTMTRGILVLDELTAFLSAEETQLLHRVIRETADRGNAVLFVSHDLDEVLRFADTATVLRSGQVVGRRRVENLDADELFRLIVGHARERRPEERSLASDRVPSVRVIEAGLVTGGKSSFDVRRGEVVGLTGLLGSGFEELPYMLFGALGSSSGRMELGGSSIQLQDLDIPSAMALGIALVPGDRLAAGLFDSLPISENIVVLKLSAFRRGLQLSWHRINTYAAKVIKQFAIVAHSPAQEVLTLSGGNQQRVLLAKWFESEATLFLLHEPVRGVDVEARSHVRGLVRAQANKGASMICASNDYEFLSEIADRVLVFRDGTVVDELSRPESGVPIEREAIEWACLNRKASVIPLGENEMSLETDA